MQYRNFMLIGIVAILMLFLFDLIIAEPPNYTISGDSVYMDDINAYISVTPHTLNQSGWVNLTIISKQFTGDVDLVIGFNSTIAKPQKVKLYNPRNVTVQRSLVCDTSYPGFWYNYTTSPKHLWCWRNRTYISNSTSEEVTETELIFNHSFGAYDLSENKIMWNESRQEDWRNVANKFTAYDFIWQSFDKFYLARDLPVIADKEYELRLLINVHSTLQSLSGKYIIGIKPSSETLAEAKANDHLYILDPWYSTTYLYRKNITCTSMDDLIPIALGGSNGTNDLPNECGKQVIWSYCSGIGTSLYYNDCDDYVVANDTDQLPMDVEMGNSSNFNPTDVYFDEEMVHYNFENDSGPTINVTNDSTSYGYEGYCNTTFVTTSCNWSDGFFGGGIHLNGGVNDHLVITPDLYTNFDINESTMMMWFNITDAVAVNDYFYGLAPPTQYNVQWINSSRIKFTLFGNEQFCNLSAPVTDGWHHIATTCSGSNNESHLYFDGVPCINASGDFCRSTTPTGNFWVGEHPDGGVSNQEMSIDSFRVINKSLTESEILQINNNGINVSGYGNVESQEVNNSLPNITAHGWNATTAVDNDALSCNVTTEDPESTILTIEYFIFNGTEEYASGNSTVINGTNSMIYNLSANLVANGDSWVCNVSSHDDLNWSHGHEYNTTSIAITAANVAPVVNAIGWNTTTAFTAHALSCNVTANDTENETLFVEYFIFNGTEEYASGNSSVANGTNSLIYNLSARVVYKGENWSCNVSAYDGTDWSNSHAYNTTSIVINNTAPEINFFGWNATTAYYNDALSCNVTVNDTENTTLEVEYFIFNGSIEFASGNSSVANGTNSLIYNLSIGFIKPNQNWSCNVSVWDGDNWSYNQDYNTSSILVSNYVPNLTAHSWNVTSASENYSLSCNVTAIDNENSTLFIEYFIYNETSEYASGNSSVTNNTNSMIYNLSAGLINSNQNWSCNVSAWDGYNWSHLHAYNTTSLTVSDTEDPVLAFVIPTNLTQSANNFVFVNVSVNDSSSDISVCLLEWNTTNYTMTLDLGGTNAFCSYNLTNLPEGNQSFIVYANDTSDNVNNTGNYTYIHNTPPNITTPTLSVTAADINAICNATYSDTDGDPHTLYYDWFIGGVLSYSYTNTTSLDDNLFNQGDSLVCQITPNDGYENGTARNSSSIQVPPKSAGGGGGGSRRVTTTLPVFDRPFIITPRFIDPDDGDIPARANLKDNDSVAYTITSQTTINQIIRIHIKGFEYDLSTNHRVNSEEFVQVSPSGMFNLASGESNVISIMSMLPPDATGLYSVELYVISDNYTEMIDVNLDGTFKPGAKKISLATLSTVAWGGTIKELGWDLTIYWWYFAPLTLTGYLVYNSLRPKKRARVVRDGKVEYRRY